jgi:uncharacterized protein YggE
MKRFALALLTGAALVCAAAAPGMAQDAAGAAAFNATTLNLNAYGETRISPDMATITFGVMTQAPTAAAAMAANRTRMNALAAALRAQGVADRDIQTSGLNLNAQYNYVQNQPPKLTGYQAQNDVTITARDLARLGATVDAVVAAGANQINGIAFGLQNPRAAEDQARLAAVRALTAKAELYAQAAGLRVTRLINLSEGGGYTPPPPRPMMMRMAADSVAAQATNIEPGELRVRIDVTGMYELGR